MVQALSEIFETPRVEVVACGMSFTEGPVWHPGGYLLFVDILRNLLLRWTPGQGVCTIREATNQANGVALDQAGRILLCEGGSRRLTRMESDGTWRVLADRWCGKKLNRPNDVIVRSDGVVYFTDPGLRIPPAERELDLSPIWRLSNDGKLEIAASDCPYPNGLALSPDESILYVSNSRLDHGCDRERDRGQVCRHRYVKAYDVGMDGTLSNPRKYSDMSSSEEGVPDGMKVDQNGTVFCTGSGGIWIFDALGRRLGVVRLPEIPANCAFGADDRRTLYVTARTSIYSLRVRTPGVSTGFAGAGQLSTLKYTV